MPQPHLKMSPDKEIRAGLSIVIFIIFMYLLYLNHLIDTSNAETLGKIVCHKEIPLPAIKEIDALAIEAVIEGYWKKRAMNKSNCSRIVGDIKSGLVRGAISSAIGGAGAAGIASGALVFGSISGVMRAYGLLHGKSSYLLDFKHT